MPPMLQDLLPGTSLGPKDGQNFEYGWQNDFFEAYLITNVGLVRTHNEDCAVICAPSDPKVLEEHGLLFAVADGMGGANAGEIASHMALHNIVSQYYHGPSDQEIPSSLREAVQEANIKVYEQAQENEEYQGMGTTVSSLIVKDNWAYIAQVGDSRVYLHRQGLGLRQLTRDHSYVAKQIRKGELSPEEAENHELKNLITRSVGIKDKVKVDLFHLELQPNDTFMICSDGLCGLVSDDVIAETIKIRGVRTKTFTMINKALESGGHDNVSVICLQVNKLPDRAPAPQPTIIKPHLQGATPKPQTPLPQKNQAKTPSTGEVSPFEGLDDLDDEFESFDSIHIDLESEHGIDHDEDRPPSSGAYRISESEKKIKPPLILWITLGLGILLMLVALFWVMGGGNRSSSSRAPAPISPIPQEVNPAQTIHPAIKMYDTGATYQQAMREAKSLFAQSDAEENAQAIENLRNRFVEKVELLLSKAPYSANDQEQAASMVAEALEIDEHPTIQQLQIKVQHEIAAHKFMLIEVDSEDESATIAINNQYYPEKQQTVRQGDLLQDRFRIELITPQRVRLADTQISGPAGQRMLTAHIRMPVSDQ